jgi:hypothetical protein
MLSQQRKKARTIVLVCLSEATICEWFATTVDAHTLYNASLLQEPIGSLRKRLGITRQTATRKEQADAASVLWRCVQGILVGKSGCRAQGGKEVLAVVYPEGTIRAGKLRL